MTANPRQNPARRLPDWRITMPLAHHRPIAHHHPGQARDRRPRDRCRGAAEDAAARDGVCLNVLKAVASLVRAYPWPRPRLAAFDFGKRLERADRHAVATAGCENRL